jgi:uncharacterized protein YdeI (YjbR/CyaY-like superfamily)
MGAGLLRCYDWNDRNVVLIHGFKDYCPPFRVVLIVP